MSGLALGIAWGVTSYYDEAERIDLMPTTTDDGERVCIHEHRR